MSVKFVVGGLLGFIGGGIASFFVTKRLLEVETDGKIKEEIDAYHQFIQEKVIKADNINEHDNRVKNSFLDEIMNKTERFDMGYRTEVREFLDGFYIEEDKGEVDNNNKEDFSGKNDISIKELRERSAKERKAYNKVVSDYIEVEDSDEGVEDFMKKYEKEHGIEYDDDEDEDEDYEKEEPIRGANDVSREPYIISESVSESTRENEDWDLEFLYYHVGDDTLYDGGGAVVDVEDTIGQSICDGLNLGDCVIVRNEYQQTDYEVSAV